MTFEAIMNDLSQRKYAPCYLLAGEEPFFIDEVTRCIEQQVLAKEDRDFNQLVFYGNDTQMEQVVHATRQFPMIFTSPQVIILKEAQQVRTGWDLLADYMESPLESTILVIAYKKKFDKRTKLYKTAAKSGVFLDSTRLYDDRVPEWARKYAAAKGYSITPDALMMLIECVGTDLEKLAGEIQKLEVVLPKGTKHITAEIVEKNIGVSKEYNIFELQKALAEKDVLKSNRIVDYFGTNPNAYPMVKVISILYPYFAKLLRFHFVRQRPPAEQASLLGVSPYFLREYETAARRYSPRRLVDIIHLLHIYDARAKGAEGTLSASSHAMLKELVYKILH